MVSVVSEKNNNNIINSKSTGVTESGLWNIFINNETGKQTYKPTDVNYFNNRYHANKKEIICDICGNLLLIKR
jgi:1,4-alpha-glucan branching enzyme